jgi:hypothetical protein
MFNLAESHGIFENFEVNAEPFWPRISRWMGGSVVLHIILAMCVIFIPPVRDALSIALVLSGGRFVDKPYTKTQIENQGEIVELTTERFHYPEGYFAMDQPPLPNASPTPVIRPVIPQPAFHPNPELLKPTPSPLASPTPATIAKASPAPSPSVDPEAEKARQAAEAELDKIAAENGVKRPKEINTRPFKDLLAAAKKKKDAGELNLSGQIELTIEADRADDGKLLNAQVHDKRGDKTLESVALDFVSALSDSGVLDFLEGTKHIKLIAKIDDQTVEVTASSEVESEERARQMEKGFSLLIVGGRIAKRGKDEEVYYNHTQVTSKDKEVSVKFSMPRSEMSQLITKYAAEQSP